MENNQQENGNTSAGAAKNSRFTGNQPGQQLPAGAPEQQEQSTRPSDENERHSESGFPKKEGETLGTP